MSSCFGSSAPLGEPLCIIPCVDGQHNGEPCPSSVTGTQTTTHNISTGVSATFGSHTIPIMKTDRSFSITSSVISTSPYAMTAAISESINQTRCVLHYINSAEEVCLYRKTVTLLVFSGTDSGCVSSLHFWNTYSKIKVSGFSVIKQHTYVLLRKGVEEILGTYNETLNSTGVWKMFLAPTPDIHQLQADADVTEYGFYNNYTESCFNAPADSNTVKDGGPDMFYPEWARDYTPDSLWEQVAAHKFQLCQSSVVVPEMNFGFAIPAEPIPIGDFARHPLLGDCHSWLLNLGADGGYVVKNYNEGALADVLLSKSLEPHNLNLKALTAYYPVSII